MNKLFTKMMNSKLGNLTHIPRWSGQQYLKMESVSDHVWGMTSLAFELIPVLNDLKRPEDKEIDLKDVIFRIQLHDLDESLCCDIPRNLKYHNEEIHTAIENTVHQLMSKEFTEEFVHQIEHAKDKSIIEGLFVAVFDVLQAILYMHNEIRLGNSTFKSEIGNAVSILMDLNKINFNPLNTPNNDPYYYAKMTMHEFITECVTYFSKYTEQ